MHAQSCSTLATQWTIAHQVPLSMEFSSQKFWSELPFPNPVNHIFLTYFKISFIFLFNQLNFLADFPELSRWRIVLSINNNCCF